MSQVLRRARWRASNSGLRMDAACLTAEIIAGPRSSAVNVSRDAKRCPDDRRGPRHDFRRCGQLQSAHVVAELRIVAAASERGHVLGRQPGDAGQVGPLVVEWFQRGGVEEQCCAVLAAFAVERRGDEVAHAAAGVDVLGREQSVIAAEAHAAAELKRLAEQAGRDLRAADADVAWAKKIQTCAPRPDCDTSNAAGT